MDKADQAQIEIERTEKRIIDSAKQAAVEPTEDCVSCGFEIPEERRKVVKTNLCVGCAEFEEVRAKGFRRV